MATSPLSQRLGAIVALILGCTTPAPLVAQDTSRVRLDGWLVGGSIGLPGYDSEPVPELFTVAIHGTSVRPGSPGIDVSVGTMPRVLVEGVLPVGARAGLALPLALSPDVLLLPSAGVSVIAAFGGGGGGAAAGLNVGVAVVLLQEESLGLRFGVTWHRFEDFGGVWLAELGVVRL